MSILSKNHTPIALGIATLVWIFGGTFWFNQYCCPANAPLSIGATSAILNSGNHTPFYFSRGESHPVFLSESFKLFKETADFLQTNQDRALVIKGLYSSKELQKQPIAAVSEALTARDLGIERAESIRTVLLHLGISPDALSVKSVQRDSLFFVNGQLFDGVEFAVVDNIEGRFQALNLFFKKKKYSFKANPELKKYFHDLNHYLSFHPDIRLKITAHADDTEGGQMSRKRLVFIKQFLKDHDFDTDKILFEDLEATAPIDELGSIKNQRIEIRLGAAKP
jgi:outer membrane protein OmpA-like peptidoglycan-associated protein